MSLFKKNNATNLNIETPENILIDVKTITSFQCKRENYPNYYQDNVIVRGRSKTGEPIACSIPLYNSNPEKTHQTGGIYSAGLRQLFVDYLYQNNLDFKDEYNKHMQDCIQRQNAYAIKYTGKIPLPVQSIKKIGLDNHYKYSEQIIYTAPKTKLPLRTGKGSR